MNRVGLSLVWVLCAAFGAGCLERAAVNPKAIRHNRDGAALIARGALGEAESHFDLAIEYHSRYEKPYYNKGVIAFLRGNDQIALGAFLRAAEINPDYADAYNGAGRVFLRRGELSDAEDYFRRALQVNPGLTAARYNLARVFVARNRLDRAEKEYRKLLVSDPKAAEGHAGIAAVFHARGELARAAGRYRRALELDGRLEEALLGLGAVRLRQRKMSAALRAYHRAVVSCPASARARHALAFALLSAGKAVEGRLVLARLRRIFPAYAPGHYLAGRIAMHERRHLAAEAAFRRALRARPRYIEAQYQICRLMVRAGRPAEARRACTAFSEAAPPRYAKLVRTVRKLIP